ncbi:family 2 glycosyl transferase [uncultured Psychroserpens sp.]|uniref:family 2 glycosyl transferase n=1 Tax=uncultured Psychroserpens sp. TaxID=255436 RepID=UPI00261E56CC|nr:family 2 glycosyl transferase [uncultured Psychroserpens sp.]
MKTGIILIFHNYEKHINKEVFITHANQFDNIMLCLVNNDSKDNTYNVLKEIKTACDNVSVVNIKKFKSDAAAVRAGARFLNSTCKLDHIGYVNTNILSLKANTLEMVLKLIKQKQYAIIEYRVKLLSAKSIKQTLFKKLFPILDCITKIELENQHSDSFHNPKKIIVK